MTGAHGPDLITHVYRPNRFWKTIYLLGGLAYTSGSLLFFTLQWGETDRLISIFGGLIFLFIGFYCIACFLRLRLTIQRDTIELRGPLRTQSASLNELHGYREVERRNGKSTLLIRKSGKVAMRIYQVFRTDEHDSHFLRQIRNLDSLSIAPDRGE